MSSAARDFRLSDSLFLIQLFFRDCVFVRGGTHVCFAQCRRAPAAALWSTRLQGCHHGAPCVALGAERCFREFANVAVRQGQLFSVWKRNNSLFLCLFHVYLLLFSYVLGRAPPPPSPPRLRQRNVPAGRSLPARQALCWPLLYYSVGGRLLVIGFGVHPTRNMVPSHYYFSAVVLTAIAVVPISCAGEACGSVRGVMRRTLY